MISKVSIKDFRGLNVEANLKKINVVVGKNGTGKTSFLEAIFLSSLFYSRYTEYEIEGLILYTLNSRGNAFSSYFTIGDAEVIMREDNEELKVVYKREDPYTLDISCQGESAASILVEPLRLVFSEGSNLPSYTIRVKVKQKELPQRILPVYLSTHFDSSGIPEMIISKARYKGKKSNFEILQDVYGSYNVYYLSEEKAIPAYVIGRGVLKEELIKDSLSYASLVLIDEIEDSLHPDMLIRLLKRMKETNTQVVFTTHSNEVIKFVTDIFEDNEANIIYLFGVGDYKVYYEPSLFKDFEKPLSWVGYL